MDRKTLRNFTHNADNFLEIGNINYKQWVFRYTFLELEKDLGGLGDVTSDCLIKKDLKIRASILAKGDGIFAGKQEIKYFLVDSASDFKPRLKDAISLNFRFEDGEAFKKGDVLLEIEGFAKDILAVERVVLNLLMRMSGVATFTQKVVKMLTEYDVLITPTRKALWGLLDKRAVVLGGGGTHRINLSDAILIKDNHLKIVDYNFTKIFDDLCEFDRDFRFVEFEVESVEHGIKVAELFRAYSNKLKTIGCLLLDNMTPDMVGEFIDKIKVEGFYDHLLFEASGGITELNVTEYAKTGVDIVSMGSLTSGVKSIDMSLEVE